MTVESIIFFIARIYQYMIIVYVLLSWLPNARESFIGEMLGRLVEPYLAPFRRFIPPIFGMIDISPIVALIVLNMASYGLVSLIGYFV